MDGHLLQQPADQVWALFREPGRQSISITCVPPPNVANLSRRFSGWSNGFIDYDNDGWKDIYSANGDVDYLGDNSAQHDTMLKNRNGTSFEDVSSDLGKDFLHMGYQRGSAFADLNDDGFLDIVVTSLNEKPRILMNSGRNGNHWVMLDLQGQVSPRDAIGAKVKVVTESGRSLYSHVSTSVGFISTSDRRVHFGLGTEAKIDSIEINWPSGIHQVLKSPGADQIIVLREPKDK